MGVKRHLNRLQGMENLGFPTGATGVGSLVFPIDEREQALVHPVPPHGRKAACSQIRRDTLPPKLHQSRQGRELLTDLGHGVAQDLKPFRLAPMWRNWVY